MLLVLWEYDVTPEQVEAFEALYRPDGEWTGLFHGSLGYVSTTLWRDDRDPGRFIVADRWTSSAAYESFKRDHETAYAELSERGRRLYRSESELGRFTVVE